MKVTLWHFDIEDAVNRMWVAARTCYSTEDPETLMTQATMTSMNAKLKLIKEILGKGHLSIVEQIQFTFMVSGVSRALSHQFMRHRHMSPAQQSQRYCKFDNGFSYVIPDSIKSNDDALEGYNILMKAIADSYKLFVAFGIPAEDARYILPNAACTNFVTTMNTRELMHICHERLCLKAQSEIRSVVKDMAAQVVEKLPFLKEYLVPKCEYLGYCTEGKRSCGRFKTKDKVIK